MKSRKCIIHTVRARSLNNKQSILDFSSKVGQIIRKIVIIVADIRGYRKMALLLYASS